MVLLSLCYLSCIIVTVCTYIWYDMYVCECCILWCDKLNFNNNVIYLISIIIILWYFLSSYKLIILTMVLLFYVISLVSLLQYAHIFDMICYLCECCILWRDQVSFNNNVIYLNFNNNNSVIFPPKLVILTMVLLSYVISLVSLLQYAHIFDMICMYVNAVFYDVIRWISIIM